MKIVFKKNRNKTVADGHGFNDGWTNDVTEGQCVY